MIKLMRYLRDYKLESVVGPLFKFFEACLELLVPIVMARVIDVGVKNGDSGYILRMGAVLAAFALSGVVCALTAHYFAPKASMGFGTKLRADLYRHVNRLSFAELDTAGAPTLITRLTSDANQAQASINLTLRLLLRSPFIVLGAIAMAFTIDARDARHHSALPAHSIPAGPRFPPHAREPIRRARDPRVFAPGERKGGL